MGFNYASKIQSLINAAEGQERSAQRYAAEGDHERAAAFLDGAANFRSKAEQLMREYRIAEEDLLAQDVTAVKIEMERVTILDQDVYTNQFRNWYWTLFLQIAEHTGCRAAYRYEERTAIASQAGSRDMEASPKHLVGYLVGYEGDLRYAEYLWTAARLAFVRHVDPTPDPSLAEAENIYRLRNAGVERNRIARMLWGSAMDDGAAHGKVAKIYKAECERRGESPKVSGRSVNAKTYREAFAREFVWGLTRKLRTARDAADSVGGALVLHGRRERVDEEFYTRFPSYRPSTEIVKRECDDCKKTKHASGKCQMHRPRKWTQADQARYERHYNSPAAAAAAKASQAAIDEVDVRQEAGRAKRIEDGGRADIERIAFNR